MTDKPRKNIAAIVTTYYPRSHADVIPTKYMAGFPTDEGLKSPRVNVASMYIDQKSERDIGYQLAERYNVPVYTSILKALTLEGGELAVDGVLLIGEHGDYPYNEFNQHMYPRRYLFEQICGVFASSGRSVPVFCDKHFAYNWPDAEWMYRRAKELNVPLMAGSSLPTCWRNPYLEHELETPISGAVAIGYGGTESYGFHALETLQCMIERRTGGESGVVAVQALSGDAVWAAGKNGLWDWELADAACNIIEDRTAKPLETSENPVVFLLEHSDGLRSAVLMLSGSDFAYACRMKEKDKILATEFYLQNGDPYAHFSYLGLNIEEMFLTGEAQYPAERTLLTTGVLDAVMQSLHQGGARIETPHLAELSYRSYLKLPVRPLDPRPTGATLDPWPPESAE